MLRLDCGLGDMVLAVDVPWSSFYGLGDMVLAVAVSMSSVWGLGDTEESMFCDCRFGSVSLVSMLVLKVIKSEKSSLGSIVLFLSWGTVSQRN